jgi:NAD(P)-dependent dehydrogenase (short-subunit alcohol dehydrogenase family)
MTEPTALDASKTFAWTDKRVVVTGAGHGLGLAVASAFTAAGALVAALDIDEEAFTAELPFAPNSWMAVDMTSDASVQAAIVRAAEEMGGIDILVNNAAIYPTGSFAEMGADGVARVLDVNVLGYVRAVNAASPWLKSSDAGRIVNVASTTFLLGIPAGLGAYITSKGAVVGMTRALAKELGPFDVTVNAVLPGAFPTRAERIIEDQAAYHEFVLTQQAIQRRGDVADIASAVLFLSSAAAGFITGQSLVVDGGWAFN